MHSRGVCSVTLLALATLAWPAPSAAQQDEPQATFRSSVDLVSVAAVVRDKKGRIVRSLTEKDFIALDEGQPRKIVGVHADETAPAGVALLVDGSGSMRLASAVASAQSICEAILGSLRKDTDLAALLSFDTRLLTLRGFSGDHDHVRAGLTEVGAFGSTSIYDAIGGTAALVAEGSQKRRAVVVITDGADNASSHTPEEVAWVASTIDVPVYVFAVGDLTTAEMPANQVVARRNALFELARATGGDYYFASSPTLVKDATARLLEELRHQYFIAFEPASGNALRRISVHTRNGEHRVRARKWYSTDGD